MPKASRLFPYYAGYSANFADHLIASANLKPEAIILDPWNGSGTTLLSAARQGFHGVGFDLNPVMVIVAKAGLLQSCEPADLINKGNLVLERAAAKLAEIQNDDPLLRWFAPSSVAQIRAVEQAINELAFEQNRYTPLDHGTSLKCIPPMYAFLYVCLFRAIRNLLKDFIPSNPTWVKGPLTLANRKRPKQSQIASEFSDEICGLSNFASKLSTPKARNAIIDVELGNSENLLLQNESIDFILTSPPYCTRIDYAVATSIELAVMRFSKEQFRELRNSLLGTSSIRNEKLELCNEWGSTCAAFLEQLYSHSSQASRGYYFKNHLQYFSALYKSVLECTRVLRHSGNCVYVVQDSFYKDIHNDVATIVTEMFKLNGLNLVQKSNFSKNNSISVINARAKKYSAARKTVETVLIFQK